MSHQNLVSNQFIAALTKIKFSFYGCNELFHSDEFARQYHSDLADS